MPLIATRGAASAQGFGEFAQSAAVTYIEEVFSTFLYTGQGSTNSYVNGIDLAGKGGLVWIKARSGTYGTAFNGLWDTARGTGKFLSSNTTGAQSGNSGDLLSAFNSDGFTVNVTYLGGFNETTNASATNYCSWTFRKQPKFFDVVTYTGNGAVRTLAHNLGSVPGCVLIKCTSLGGTDWMVFHRSASTGYLYLNSTSALMTAGAATFFGNGTSVVAPDATSIYLGSGDGQINQTSATYVAYVLAHDAGGFGLTGTDNVITCGSYTGAGASTTVTLGYEPQWVMIRNTAGPFPWWIQDNMRGMTVTGDNGVLNANSSAAEAARGSHIVPTATGFTFTANEGDLNGAGSTYIYIAIRRGPMKVPTSGTSVLGLNARTGTGANATVTGSAGVSDAVLVKNRGSAVASLFSSRLTSTGYLVTSSDAAEVAAGTTILQASPWDVMDGVKVGTTSTITNASANTYINYLFDRAPSFFDVVCYTGTGANRTVSHNLGAVPELMLVKARSTAGYSWCVYSATLGPTYVAFLNLTSAFSSGAVQWNSTTPTSSVFSLSNNVAVNNSGTTYVAYLFATCAGVSKVGSYTGTATTKQIDCGFTAGARFVLIKRTDSTGDWYVWDSARGIVAGNDPYLLLNSTAAEVTSTDYVDTYSAGFEISSTAPAAINASGGTYIFLAIA